jgi:hypothetical protein
MIQAIVLICLSTVAPADCTRETATHYAPLTAEQPVSPIECAMVAQEIIASTRLAGNGRYLKVLCEVSRG